MRLSMLLSDPGFAYNAYKATITIDGEINKSCVTADDELGEVLCYETSADGGFVIEGEGNSARHKLITRKGVVTIEMPEKPVRK